MGACCCRPQKTRIFYKTREPVPEYIRPGLVKDGISIVTEDVEDDFNPSPVEPDLDTESGQMLAVWQKTSGVVIYYDSDSYRCWQRVKAISERLESGQTFNVRGQEFEANDFRNFRYMLAETLDALERQRSFRTVSEVLQVEQKLILLFGDTSYKERMEHIILL